MSKLNWRIALTALILVIGVLYLLPSVPGVKNSALGKILPDRPINLGLDLKGGIHLTLGVEAEKALGNYLEQTGRDIRERAKEKNITLLKPEVKGESLLLTLIQAAQGADLDKIISDTYGKVLNVEGRDNQGDKTVYRLRLSPEMRKWQMDFILDQAVQTIRNRIDQFGVTEPDIRRQEGGRIQIQLPGLDDPQRAIDIIGKTAHLEFRIVNDEVNIEDAKAGKLPPGVELLPMITKKVDKSQAETPVVVSRTAAMTGDSISDARIAYDNYNQAYVALAFDPRGAKLFEKITEENTKKRMAIVLDGKVYSAPVIQERIAGGRASITGQFTPEQARDLAIVLRAGALPAPVTVLEERTVGPSLGQESIDAGIKAALIGFAAIFLFMIVYYGLAGLIADICMLLNLVLLMASMAMFGATLTMPGIAGIILTLGMAVDANVIIYERIREELRRGMTPVAAVEEGYKRAAVTILDANVTNIITALILYEFGTGPIRGFAVTLSIGLLISLFTAIFVSKIIFDLYLAKRSPAASLSI